MNKLTSFISKAPKRTSAIITMLAAALIVPATLYAWGPSRQTFTIEKPADYVTFNSITNNPSHGDERNFMQIREATASNTTYADSIALQAGKEYVVYIYYHNNAATNLNASGKGIATGAYTKAELPAVVPNGSTGTKAVGYVGAANATPTQVWDDISLSNKTGGDIALRYVAGSATIHNFGKTNGATMSDNIVTTGAALGYDTLDGKLPGCNEYAGYVTFRFKADQPNFTVSKQVHKTGETGWKESESVKPGDSVDYLVTYKNTGTTQQNDVVIKDVLPKGVTYVAGSTQVANSTNPNGIKVGDNIATSTGINIGNYAAGAAAYVKFTAKVASNDNLPTCSANTLRNVAKAETNNGTKEDTADVVVSKECKPVAKYTCDSLTVTKLERTKFKFETKYTVQNATFKNVTYVVRNASGDEVYRGTNSTYTQTTVGKYSVQAIVTVTVDGSDKTVTSDGCKKEFEVVKEKTPAITIDKKVNGVEKAQVAVGEEFTYQLVVKNTGEVDLKNAVVSDPAPTNVQFISADKGTITDNKWSYTIAELKVGKSESFAIKAKVTKEVTGTIVNTACVDTPQIPGSPDDCDDAKVEVPKTPKIEVCELDTKKIVTIDESAFDSSKYSKDLNDCAEIPVTPVTPETPETPSELPQTGMSENILALTGLGALIASAAYYIASRRALGL